MKKIGILYVNFYVTPKGFLLEFLCTIQGVFFCILRENIMAEKEAKARIKINKMLEES